MTTAHEELIKLTEGLSPVHQMLAASFIPALDDATAESVLASLNRYRNMVVEGDIDGAVSALVSDYPDVGPYLAAFDIRGVLSAAASNS